LACALQPFPATLQFNLLWNPPDPAYHVMSVITINGNTFDPHAPTVIAFGLEAETAKDTNYIIVQITGRRLSKDQQQELAAKHVKVHEYVSDGTYLCGYEPEDLSVIRSLPFVKYVNTYQQLFVIPPHLKVDVDAPGTQTASAIPAPPLSRIPIEVDILLHQDVDLRSEEVKSKVAAAAHADPKSIDLTGGKIRLHVEQQYLNNVAAIDQVRYIQRVHPITLCNNVARGILDANVVINGTPYRGRDQVIAVADTGFDNGDINDIPAPFTGRVLKLYALGRPEIPPTPTDPGQRAATDDFNGHGTHVAGSVLGDGFSASMGGRIEAPASQAELVMQCTMDGSGALSGIPSNLQDLFEVPYANDGARIFSNSWGSNSRSEPPAQLSYLSTNCEDIDKFVWGQTDAVILFAAGNTGRDSARRGVVDFASLGAQAAAKNCITVGATESLRPNFAGQWGSMWPTRYTAAPIQGDPVANNIEGMAAFSSRGPTMEGRRKPDVVAPGTCILSVNSRAVPSPSTGWGVSSDPDWCFMGGTSMATPLVAGCCAVIRESLVRNGLPNPSAALIKALLINGAVDVDGQYTPTEAGPSPNLSSGYGRVDLAGSIVLPGQDANANAGLGDNQDGLTTGGEATGTVTIQETKPNSDRPSSGKGAPKEPDTATPYPSPTFKMTLVYPDFPGALLQNDLNLVVIAPDGSQERHGNMGTASFPAGTEEVGTFDGTNNVEQVVWQNVPAGELTWKIKAPSVLHGPQPYAWVWRVYY
jgi:serine protease AprX